MSVKLIPSPTVSTFSLIFGSMAKIVRDPSVWRILFPKSVGSSVKVGSVEVNMSLKGYNSVTSAPSSSVIEVTPIK